jgi:hypothetical protein
MSFGLNLQTDFGAIGNGIADDTAAINSALASGRLVYVPAGTYLCTSSLNTITNGTRFQGEGKQLSTLKGSSTSINLLHFTGCNGAGCEDLGFDTCNIAILVGVYCNNCNFKNILVNNAVIGIEVSGNYNVSPVQDCIGHSFDSLQFTNISSTNILLTQCADITINNVQTATNGTAIGINIESGANSLRISQCNLSGCSYGLIVNDTIGSTYLPSNPHQLFFNQVLCDSATNHCCWIVKGYQIHFIDSWFCGSKSGTGINIGDGNGGAQQIELIGCRVLNNYLHGANVVGCGSNAIAVLVNFLGGHYICNGNKTPGTYSGIYIEPGVWRFKIIGVDCYSAATMGNSNIQAHGICVSGPNNNAYVIMNNNANPSLSTEIVDGGTGGFKSVSGNL